MTACLLPLARTATMADAGRGAAPWCGAGRAQGRRA